MMIDYLKLAKDKAEAMGELHSKFDLELSAASASATIAYALIAIAEECREANSLARREWKLKGH